jgi:hypothetical protein
MTGASPWSGWPSSPPSTHGIEPYRPTSLQYGGALTARTDPTASYRATWVSSDPAASVAAVVTG